jgi:hypothetical protein
LDLIVPLDWLSIKIRILGDIRSIRKADHCIEFSTEILYRSTRSRKE